MNAHLKQFVSVLNLIRYKIKAFLYFLPKIIKDHKTCKDHYKKVKKLNKYLVNANNEATENKWNAAFETLDSAQTANKDNIHAVNSEIAQLKCRGAAYMQQTENIDYCNK